MGRRLLVSERSALGLAGGLLGSEAVCARQLGWTALVRRPLVRRLLAPVTLARSRAA